jgi:3',5'-cyclic AMP phosphodiesterase CpdA
VLNSIYFSVRNTEDLATARAQMAWLENELALAHSRKKYIISMHIPPMLFSYSKSVEDFW